MQRQQYGVMSYYFDHLLLSLVSAESGIEVCDDGRFRNVQASFDVLPAESTTARSRPSSRSSVYVTFIYHLSAVSFAFHCFDTVDWSSGRASGLYTIE